MKILVRFKDSAIIDYGISTEELGDTVLSITHTDGGQMTYTSYRQDFDQYTVEDSSIPNDIEPLKYKYENGVISKIIRYKETYTLLEFRNKFSLEERSIFDSYYVYLDNDVTIDSDEKLTRVLVLNSLLKDLELTYNLSMDSNVVSNFLSKLVEYNIITQSRVQEILQPELLD